MLMGKLGLVIEEVAKNLRRGEGWRRVEMEVTRDS